MPARGGSTRALGGCVTIKAFRLYFHCRDDAIERRISQSHWGVCYWINKRLKEIAPALKGPEVKGINLANVLFCEAGTSRIPVGSWNRLLNALEYALEYDTPALELHSARQNLPELLLIAADAAREAPYPQLQAIGELLSNPLTVTDLDDIEREIDAQRQN
jgi:hypothetical protein